MATPRLRHPTSSLVALVALVVATVPALLAATRWTAAIVSHRDTGLDVSDESLYLLLVTHPSRPRAIASDVGFYLRPLYRLAGGDLGWFRVSGLVLLALAAVATAWALVGWVDRRTLGAARRAAVVAALSVVLLASLAPIYGLWLVTPNYNLLTVVLLVLAVAGTLVAIARPDAGRARPASLAAVGAVVVAGVTVKGPAFAGAALGLGAVLLLGIARRRWLVGAAALAVGVVAGLVVHWFVVVDGPVADLRRLSRGAHAAGLLGAYSASTVWETDFLTQRAWPWLWRAALVTAVAFAVRWRWPRLLIRATVPVVAMAVTVVVLWSGRPHGGSGMFEGEAGWWWFRLSAIAVVAVLFAAERLGRSAVVGGIIWAVAVVATLGTGNGFVRQLALVPGLLVLGIVVLAGAVAAPPAPAGTGSDGWNPWPLAVAAVAVAAAGVVSFTIVPGAVASPYRLAAPLGSLREPVELAATGRIEVDAALARYLTGLEALGVQLPDAARSCFVDLTGGTPVSALALGVVPASPAWIPGGYPGSAEFAEYTLDGVDCLSGPVALLVAPSGTRAVAEPAALRSRARRLVGEVRYVGYLDEVQQLYLLDPAGRDAATG